MLHKVVFFAVVVLLASCASTTTVSFMCDNQDLEIYVNDNYVGTGLVTYVVPKRVSVAEVCCKKNGIDVLKRSYDLHGLNHKLIELKAPTNMGYSSGSMIHSK